MTVTDLIGIIRSTPLLVLKAALANVTAIFEVEKHITVTVEMG